VKTLGWTAITIATIAACAVTTSSAQLTTLAIEVSPSTEVASHRIEHGDLHALNATCWRSHLGAHETVQLCTPADWSGSGDVTAKLAISSRFAPLRPDSTPAPASEVFYTGEASVTAHGTRTGNGLIELSLDVPHFTMHSIGTGSMTELTGAALDASVRGSVRLVQ
jgi:hypothetical protein